MRRTAEITITAPGRDAGKTFLLTEMSADKAERWAIRLILALAKSGVDVPQEIYGMGMAGLAMMGVHGLAGMSYDEAAPLMDEMFSCVQIVMPAGARPLIEAAGDIEEVATRIQLRGEVLAMHLGFPLDDMLSPLRAMWKTDNTPNTPTSPEPSEPSSPPA